MALLRPALLLCLLLFAPAPSNAALFSSRSAVVHLDSNNFTPLVLSGRLPYVVLFYSPSCPHCSSVAPAYTQAADLLAKEGEGGVTLGVMDGNVNNDIVRHYKISGYPYVHSLSGDHFEMSLYAGDGM